MRLNFRPLEIIMSFLILIVLIPIMIIVGLLLPQRRNYYEIRRY